MSQVESANVVTSDPGYTLDGTSVTKTVDRQGTYDAVTVDAYEDGDDAKGSAVVVLKVNCDGRASARVQSDGSVMLTASGTGVTEYLELELGQSDPDNWTIQVTTSGGSTYTFKKGSGGGSGH